MNKAQTTRQCFVSACTRVHPWWHLPQVPVLLRCKKWRCDKHSSGDVACKHQSFGRCAVSKLAVYSPRPSHTPLSGLRLIVCRLPYEEQLIHTESNCKRTEWGAEEIEEGGYSIHFYCNSNSLTKKSLVELSIVSNYNKVSPKAHREEDKC